MLAWRLRAECGAASLRCGRCIEIERDGGRLWRAALWRRRAVCISYVGFTDQQVGHSPAQLEGWRLHWSLATGQWWSLVGQVASLTVRASSRPSPSVPPERERKSTCHSKTY